MPARVPACPDRLAAGFFWCIGFRPVHVIPANTTVATAIGFTSSICPISFFGGEVSFVGAVSNRDFSICSIRFRVEIAAQQKALCLFPGIFDEADKCRGIASDRDNSII